MRNPAEQDAAEIAEARRITIRRGERAAEILGWSEARLQAFEAEAASRPAARKTSFERLDPAAFGLTEEDVHSPLPEDQMTDAQRAALGRWDAAHALMSWCLEDPRPASPEDAVHLANMYLDRFEIDAMDPGEVSETVTSIEDLRDSAFAGDPAEWIRTEHRHAMEDGRAGYVDLLVEKILTPCVYRAYESGPRDIADGWHRTAAALAMGDTEIRAVLVPLPGPSPLADDDPDDESAAPGM